MHWTGVIPPSATIHSSGCRVCRRIIASQSAKAIGRSAVGVRTDTFTCSVFPASLAAFTHPPLQTQRYDEPMRNVPHTDAMDLLGIAIRATGSLIALSRDDPTVGRCVDIFQDMTDGVFRQMDHLEARGLRRADLSKALHLPHTTLKLGLFKRDVHICLAATVLSGSIHKKTLLLRHLSIVKAGQFDHRNHVAARWCLTEASKHAALPKSVRQYAEVIRRASEQSDAAMLLALAVGIGE